MPGSQQGSSELAAGVRRVPAGFVPSSEFDGYTMIPAQVNRPAILPPLLRRKWLMLSVALAVFIAALPVIWLVLAPVYRATAVVRISPAVEPFVFQTERSRVVPFYTEFVNTEVSVIRSPTVLERVIDRPEVRQTEWFRAASGKSAATVELLQSLLPGLNVSPRRGTELIDVSVDASRPHDSKVIADAVVAEYIRLKEEMDRASSTQRLETLTTEQAELNNEIDGLIKTRFNISNRLGTAAPEELRSELSQRFNALEAELRQAQRGLAMTGWELRMVAATATQPAGKEGAVDRRMVTDANWRSLYMAAETARQRVELLGQQFGRLHPEVKKARLSVDHAERQLKAHEAQLAQIWAANPAQAANTDTALQISKEGLEYQAKKKAEEIKLLQAEVDRQRTKLNEAGDVALEIAKYDELIRQKRELYEAVRSKREQLEMEEKAPARVRLVASALEPARPDNDRRLLLSAVALVMAAGVGLGVGYLRTAMDKRIHDSREVQHMSQVPFLGLLPKLPPTHVPAELGGALVTSTGLAALNPRLLLIENMRMIRTTLLERVSRTGEKVVLITSSLPNTGKTSVAVLLAQSLAMVGKKVLLVEADLRRPVLGPRLGIRPARGLASLLSGNAGDDQAVVRAPGGRFDLVLAGELPNNFDPELMANGMFSKCIARWREHYDFVLLDSPPLLRLADAQILAGHADGTIMVLRSSHDRRAEALEAFAQLSAAGGALLGTVLIGGDFERDYYRKGYRYSPESQRSFSGYNLSGAAAADQGQGA